jgi:YbbR domain-containing protein
MIWLRKLTDNLGWKIVSVLLATLVWLLVHYNTSERFRPQRTRVFEAIPITVLAVPDDPRAFRFTPATARLAIRGTENALRALRPTDVQLFVNLSATDGIASRGNLEVHLPPGFTVISLAPTQVQIELLPIASPPDPSPP